MIDGGAYVTLSPVVLSRAHDPCGGPYYWPSVRVRAKAVATNAPPHGAFRGFGAPQSIFAIERHMDRIAQALGLVSDRDSPQKFSEAGRTTITEQTINEPIDLAKLLDRALEHADYRRQKTAVRAQRTRATRRRRESALRLFCTARDSPDRVNAI